MSTDDKTTPSVDSCACCGIAEVDDIKLKICDGGCDLVKYCSDDCQTDHRGEHEQECKKRKAEMHDKKLFTQPDISHKGECPICCLPLPIDDDEITSTLNSCCCKLICNGCCYANLMRENEQGLENRCAYCREPVATSEEKSLKQIMKRVKKNDPVALTYMGKELLGKGNYREALEYLTKAAELGDVAAHFRLSMMYYSGDGVGKDEKKAVYHWEQAAIGGHPGARGYLAAHEIENDNFGRAAKHLIIAANLGCDTSLQCIKDLFVKGVRVSKEEYAAALRGHQAAVDATKSAERKTAEVFYNYLSAR